MACGRNREYNNTCNWSRVDCSGTNQREYKPCCGNWDSRGFEWLEAMQAAAANQCEEATPVCSRTGRDNYFLEIVSFLMALMHHHYHE